MSKKENKRSKLLIDRQVQSALVRRVILHWFLFVFVTFFVIGFLQTCVETPAFTMSEVFSSFLANNSLALVVSLSLLPVFVYDVIKLTNRFAGPISRLRSELKSLANGGPAKPLVFRDGDFWAEIASDFNTAFKLRNEATSDNPKSQETEQHEANV